MQKGGFLPISIIISVAAVESALIISLLHKMRFYLMNDYGVDFHMFSTWLTITNFMPVVGGYVANSLLGRFLTIFVGCLSSFLGYMVLWLMEMLPQLKPSPCVQSVATKCSPVTATSFQMALLYCALALISIGTGGIKSNCLAFGADQLDSEDTPMNKRVLGSYVAWYYASSNIIALTCFWGVDYIQDHKGTRMGAGIPMILMLFGGSLFFSASHLYIKRNETKNVFTRLAQVAVAAYVNRKLCLPNHNGCYYHLEDSKFKAPSDKLRFLNKASVIRNREEDIGSDGLTVKPWRLCTTDQVEELKALVKVAPIWSTGLMMFINALPTMYRFLQADTMEERVSRNSRFKLRTIYVFSLPLITLTAWVVLYYCAILPLASKIRGRPVWTGVKTRMGLGLFMTSLASACSAIVEYYRLKTAIRQGLANTSMETVNISKMWLIPQFVLHGFAKAFTFLGHLEFFYNEFPRSMSAIAVSLCDLELATATFLERLIFRVVNESSNWVEYNYNFNQGHYDYYYWILTIFSFTNLIFYMFCSWSYGPLEV